MQNQLIRYFLLRWVYPENDDDLWVELNGVKMCNGLEECVLMIGLNFRGDVVSHQYPGYD